MDNYVVNIKVTLEQELAILSLFEQNGWTYNKLGINGGDIVDERNKAILSTVHITGETCAQPYRLNTCDKSSNSVNLITSSQPHCSGIGQDSTFSSLVSESMIGNSAEIQHYANQPSDAHTPSFIKHASTPFQSEFSASVNDELNLNSSSSSTSLKTQSNASTFMSPISEHQTYSKTNPELDFEDLVEKIISLLVKNKSLKFDESFMKTGLNRLLKYVILENFGTNCDKNYLILDKDGQDNTNFNNNDEMSIENKSSTSASDQLQIAESESYAGDDANDNDDDDDDDCDNNEVMKMSSDVNPTENNHETIEGQHLETVEDQTLTPSAEEAMNTEEDEMPLSLLTSKSLNGKHKKKTSKKTKAKHSRSKSKMKQSDKERKTRRSSLTPKSKFSWTVNRNLRMHKYHRKCTTIPSDLDSEMFSIVENGYYCPDCKFIFTLKTKLVLHKQLKSGHCLPECIYCDAETDNKEVFPCDKCPKCFPTSEMLERHLSKHTENLLYCLICESQTEFYTTVDLKAHMLSFHSEAMQQEHLCDLCGAKFKEKKVLNAHVKYVHSDNRPEKCKFCDKSFKTKSQLKNHYVTHQSLTDLNLSCEVCGRMFFRKSTLKDHVRRHKKEFTIFCTVCSKGFYRHYDLEEHMRVHTGDKPFDCKYCGFKCALSCNLVKHMKVHQKQGIIT